MSKRSYEDEKQSSSRKRAKIEEPSNEGNLAMIDLPMDIICIIVSHLTYSQVVR